MTRLIASALFLGSMLPGFGTAISADGSYHEFTFNLAGTEVQGCGGCTPSSNPSNVEMTSVPPWTFTGPGSLFVLDVGHTGDRFEAFDFGVSLGTTSAVANDGLFLCGFDIGCSIADARYSRGTFLLGEGPHEIHIFVIQNALGTIGGDDFFSLSAAPTGVPEPGTMLPLGIGIATVLFGRFRRKNQ